MNNTNTSPQDKNYNDCIAKRDYLLGFIPVLEKHIREEVAGLPFWNIYTRLVNWFVIKAVVPAIKKEVNELAAQYERLALRPIGIERLHTDMIFNKFMRDYKSTIKSSEYFFRK